MFLRQGRAAFLMIPEYQIGSKAYGQVVAQSARFGEELDMSGMDDVIATRDKYFFHRVPACEERMGGRAQKSAHRRNAGGVVKGVYL